ncbi:MAG: LacI family transcriptional regulator, partial [Anaerolineaceae bacterium]|nr:LacI family transcriptional regulator [Anaerolineaceae bacterium]
CFNDLMAIGALNLLNRNGILVPKDMSIAGFDNITISGYTTPPLTTFDQPKRRIGAEAADMLLNLIQSPDKIQNEGQLSRVLHGTLLARESTSPPSIKE